MYHGVRLILSFCDCLWMFRDAQEFVEKFEGALGKGKGRKLYAYKVMMAKVTIFWCVCVPGGGDGRQLASTTLSF